MNDAETLFLQGYEYYREAADADDLRKAFELLGAASSMGHALAQDILGNMYEDGDGAPLDINTAVGLYKRRFQDRLRFCLRMDHLLRPHLI